MIADGRRSLFVVCAFLSTQPALAGIFGSLNGDKSFLGAYLTGSYTPETTSLSFSASAAADPIPGAVGTFELTFINTGLFGVVDQGSVEDSGTIILQELPLSNEQVLVFSPALELEWLYRGGGFNEKSPPPPTGWLRNQFSVIAGGAPDLEASSIMFDFPTGDPPRFEVTVQLVGTITAQDFSIVPEPTALVSTFAILLAFAPVTRARRRFAVL